EDRLEGPVPLVDEDDLVALAIAEEVVHRPIRPAEGDLDIGVPHEGSPARDLVALRADVVRVLEPVRVRLGDPLLAFNRRERPELLHAARRLEVVEDRFVAREALEAHDLLGQEPAVLAEHDVALARELPARLVEGHRRPFRVAVTHVLAAGARSGRGRRPDGRRPLFRCRAGYAPGAFVSVCQSPNSLPSGSLQTENQPMLGTGSASPASPPSSFTRAAPALMSSTSK